MGKNEEENADGRRPRQPTFYIRKRSSSCYYVSPTLCRPTAIYNYTNNLKAKAEMFGRVSFSFVQLDASNPLVLLESFSSLSKQDPILSISFFRIPRDKKRKIARKVRRGEASMLFYFCCQRLCNIFVPFPRSLTAAISDITLRFLLQVEFPRSFDLVLEEELMIDRDRWRKKRMDGLKKVCRVIYIRFRSNKNILYFSL